MEVVDAVAGIGHQASPYRKAPPESSSLAAKAPVESFEIKDFLGSFGFRDETTASPPGGKFLHSSKGLASSGYSASANGYAILCRGSATL
jgi:hypothetical protein